jgi:hypothetical protein
VRVIVHDRLGRIPQQERNVLDPHVPAVEQPRGEVMPERVRAPAVPRLLEPQVLEHLHNHLRDPRSIGKNPPPPIPAPPCMLQVLDHHLGGGAEKRCQRLALALHEPRGAALDVDVLGLNPGDLTDPGAGVMEKHDNHAVEKSVFRRGIGERIGQAPGDIFLVEPPPELLALLLLALAIADPVGEGNRVPGPFHEDSHTGEVLLDTCGAALCFGLVWLTKYRSAETDDKDNDS